MLEKIISIKGVGRFQRSNASGDTTFSKYNLIFAENGRGKTTLCAILRSLQTGDASYILGRSTLAGEDRPGVVLKFNNGNATFNGSTWTAPTPLPGFAIYDSTFVSENVYSGDFVDIEHKRNLYRVIVGNEGVILARKIEELDATIRSKNTPIREQRATVDAYMPKGFTLEKFLSLPNDPQIESKIAGKQKEFDAIKQAEQIRDRATLSKISFPEWPDTFATLLSKTLEGVAADAEKRIAEHIATHKMGEEGQHWLSQGIDYIQTDNCPFCGQDLKGLPLISAYNSYFSEEYNALRQEILSLREGINNTFGDRQIATAERILDQNTTALEFWKQYCDLIQPVLNEAARAGDILRKLRVEALALLDRKSLAPLDPIRSGETFDQALADFGNLKKQSFDYNTQVGTANTVITLKKAQTQAADIRVIENELAFLNTVKVRHQDKPAKACKSYQDALSQKTDLETQKTQIRTQLDQHTEKVIGRYEQNINRYLDRFNAGFRITKTAHSYSGGVPTSTYQILINEVPVEIGDPATPLDRPSFKNTLSSGDRSTLALAFFMAQLDQDTDRVSKIVVFDDPFHSQDSFRKGCTVHQIKKCGTTCKQVIVLSHDQNFLKLIWDRLMPAVRKTIQFARDTQENTSITPWDIEKSVKAPYRADIEALQTYYDNAEGDPRTVVKRIRTVLEGFYRSVFPMYFTDQDNLGDILAKIRDGGSTHPLRHVYDELDELNEYTVPHHHGETQQTPVEPIDSTELNGYIKRTLALVGGS